MSILSINSLVFSGPLADLFGYQPPRPEPQPMPKISRELLENLLAYGAVDDGNDLMHLDEDATLDDADPVAVEKTTAAKLKGNRFLPWGEVGKLARTGFEGLGKGAHQFLGGILQG